MTVTVIGSTRTFEIVRGPSLMPRIWSWDQVNVGLTPLASPKTPSPFTSQE